MRQVQREGVTLCYVEAGGDEPAMLFVHGWTGDHSHFAPQFSHFGRRQRVVAVDLRGHGQSDKPEQDYSIAGFADDLAWLCGEIGLTKPVLVGHSLGGLVTLDLAVRYPDLPCAVVLLDAPIILPPGGAALRQALVEGLRGPDCKATARQYAANMFRPTDDPALQARLIARMVETPQHVMVAAMEGVLHWDGAAAAAACRLPVLNLSATPPRGDVARLQALCPHVVIGQTVGAGHFHQLIVPDQINAMIDRFLALNLPSPDPHAGVAAG